MKKIAYIILIVTLVIGSLQVFQGRAEACGPNSLMIIFEPLPMFGNSGQFVEYTAAGGGIIGGLTTGIVAGIPLGIVGTILGAPVLKAREGGIIGAVIPVMVGNAVGQLTAGTLVMVPKVLFYDFPKTIIGSLQKPKAVLISPSHNRIPKAPGPPVKAAAPTPINAKPYPHPDKGIISIEPQKAQ